MAQDLESVILSAQEIENIVRRLNNSNLTTDKITVDLANMQIEPINKGHRSGVRNLYRGEDVFRYLKSLEEKGETQWLPYEGIRDVMALGLHLPLTGYQYGNHVSRRSIKVRRISDFKRHDGRSD